SPPPPPPPSTLFPYTTLFRSLAQALFSPVIMLGLLYLQNPERSWQFLMLSSQATATAIFVGGAYLLIATPAAVFRSELTNLSFQDRKSTRLNSSHSQISYAVF